MTGQDSHNCNTSNYTKIVIKAILGIIVLLIIRLARIVRRVMIGFFIIMEIIGKLE